MPAMASPIKNIIIQQKTPNSTKPEKGINYNLNKAFNVNNYTIEDNNHYLI